MKRDGVLEPHDIAPSSIADEVRQRVWSDDGLFFLSRYIIGNTRLSERVHRPMLMWAQRVLTTPDALGALRDPRATGKTDGFTVATPLWCWAMVPVEGTALQSVDTCIAMVAPKKDIASNVFISSVDKRYRDCKTYRELFPWVRPDGQHWSWRNGLRLKRKLLTGIPNLLPLGMESVSTSLHPPILIIDDPIHEQNFRSQAEVARVVSWIEHSHSLTAPVHGVRMFVGNYWAIGDAQDQFHPESEECKKEYRHVQVWERGITGCETCVAGERRDYAGGGSISGRIPGHEHSGQVFPVALDKEEDVPEPVEYIAEVERSKPTFIYLTQHENKLVDPATLQFKKEWVKNYSWRNLHDGGMGIEVPIAPSRYADLSRTNEAWRVKVASGFGASELILPSELDIYILVDPAPSEEESASRSRFAAAIVGVEKRGPREFLLDEYACNEPQHKHLAWLLDAYLRYRAGFRRFGIENVGYQGTLRDALLTTARGRGIVTLREGDIEMLARLKTEGAQEDRIKYALIPKFEAGHFYVHAAHRIFRGEYATFGVKGSKHDLLDAISNLDRTRGGGGRRVSTSSRAVQDAALARRKGLGPTGY